MPLSLAEKGVRCVPPIHARGHGRPADRTSATANVDRGREDGVWRGTPTRQGRAVARPGYDPVKP
eukprot:2041551-Prymnesium_polylepis.1